MQFFKFSEVLSQVIDHMLSTPISESQNFQDNPLSLRENNLLVENCDNRFIENIEDREPKLPLAIIPRDPIVRNMIKQLSSHLSCIASHLREIVYVEYPNPMDASSCMFPSAHTQCDCSQSKTHNLSCISTSLQSPTQRKSNALSVNDRDQEPQQDFKERDTKALKQCERGALPRVKRRSTYNTRTSSTSQTSTIPFLAMHMGLGFTNLFFDANSSTQTKDLALEASASDSYKSVEKPRILGWSGHKGGLLLLNCGHNGNPSHIKLEALSQAIVLALPHIDRCAMNESSIQSLQPEEEVIFIDDDQEDKSYGYSNKKAKPSDSNRVHSSLSIAETLTIAEVELLHSDHEINFEHDLESSRADWSNHIQDLVQHENMAECEEEQFVDVILPIANADHYNHWLEQTLEERDPIFLASPHDFHVNFMQDLNNQKD